MDFRDLLKPLSQLGDDAWESVSVYSSSHANTGYTGGTRGSVNLSKHAKVRMLERGEDDYLIRHVLARGVKTELQGCWCFEKEGLVVIASEAQPSSDQYVVTTYYTDRDGIQLWLKSGFINEHSMGRASDKYEALREEMQKALDGEERLVILKAALGEECERFFFGVDLERTPPDRPLLFHCAEMGYTECARFLLTVGKFNAGLQGPKECTILHIIAYAGQAGMISVLGDEVVQRLADLSNGYGELPEITAWRRYCGDVEADTVDIEVHDDARAIHGQFLDIAVACRNARLGTADACERDFIAMAEAELQKLDPTSDSIFAIEPGVSPELLVDYFERPGQAFRHSVVLLKSVSNLHPPLLQHILCRLQGSMYLTNLTLHNCGLRSEHASVLASYLDRAADVHFEHLGLAGNPLGNDGVCSLSKCAAFFDVEVIDLSDVGMDEDGLNQMASNGLSLKRRASKFRLRKLILRRNDLSAKGHFDELEADRVAHLLQERLGTLPTVNESSNIAATSTTLAQPPENQAIGKLCNMLAHSSITNLVLDKTRLNAWQVGTLCHKLPDLVPWLTTLELVGVNLPPSAQVSIRNMLVQMDKGSGGFDKGWRSVSVGANNGFALKRIGINRLEYAELWASIQQRIKDRLKRDRTMNYTKLVGQQKDRTRVMRQAGDGTHVIRCSPNRNVCRMGLEQARGSEGFEVPLVFLYTPYGSLIARDPDKAARGIDGGAAVECILKYDAPHRCLAVSTIAHLQRTSAAPKPAEPAPVQNAAAPRIWDRNRRPTCEEVRLPPCLRSCMVVLYRVETRQVLMRAAQSDALRTLCQRLNYGVVPEKYDLECRFPGSFPKSGCRFTIEQLLANLDLGSFSDEEIHCLAHFDEPDCYMTITGGRLSVTDFGLSKIARVNACQVVCEMRAAFSAEQKQRLQTGCAIRAASRFYSVINKLDSDMGFREHEWFFPPPVNTAVKQILESHFVSASTVATVSTDAAGVERLNSLQDVSSHEADNQCTRDTIDESGVWKHRIVLIGIREDMIDTETNLPRGFLLKPASVRSQPFWVSVASVGDPARAALQAPPGRVWAREDATPLREHLGKYNDEGFKSIEEDLRALEEQFTQERCLLLVRSSQVSACVEETRLSGPHSCSSSTNYKQIQRQHGGQSGGKGKMDPSLSGRGSWRHQGAVEDETLSWRRPVGAVVKPTATKPSQTPVCLRPQAFSKKAESSLACDLSGANASGVGDIPPPCASFDACERIFDKEIMLTLRSQGFATPTTIQALSWPIAASGRDIIGVARTGSGKTLGYLLPTFQSVSRTRQGPRQAGEPLILVMAPTRELASQIHAESEKFSLPLRLRSCCCYGGVPRGPQLGHLRGAPHLVVGTPGRLSDFLSSSQLRLAACQHLVLDEADRMLDMGFKPQIDSIIATIPSTRQTFMFSATWPLDVQQLATDFLRDPVHVQIGTQDNTANRDIIQKVRICDCKNQKFGAMLDILGEISASDRVMVFVNTKRLCEELLIDLYKEGVEAVAIHGDLDQQNREDAIIAFKSGKAPVLVATDVAARGLDIKGVQFVISFDSAGKAEDHVHRIGRTGRAGMKGTAITLLLSTETRQASEILNLMESAGQDIPPSLRDMAGRCMNRRNNPTGAEKVIKLVDSETPVSA